MSLCRNTGNANEDNDPEISGRLAFKPLVSRPRVAVPADRQNCQAGYQTLSESTFGTIWLHVTISQSNAEPQVAVTLLIGFFPLPGLWYCSPLVCSVLHVPRRNRNHAPYHGDRIVVPSKPV